MQVVVRRKQLFRAVVAAVSGMVCAHSTRAVIPEYTILNLSTLGGGTSEANGIN